MTQWEVREDFAQYCLEAIWEFNSSQSGEETSLDEYLDHLFEAFVLSENIDLSLDDP
jgi:hypothetical protein